MDITYFNSFCIWWLCEIWTDSSIFTRYWNCS